MPACPRVSSQLKDFRIVVADLGNRCGTMGMRHHAPVLHVRRALGHGFPRGGLETVPHPDRRLLQPSEAPTRGRMGWWRVCTPVRHPLSFSLAQVLMIPNRFWLRMPKSATHTFKRRFLGSWIDYVESVAWQAEHRSQSRILDLNSYFPLRRNTSGAPSTIILWEMELDIPDHVRNHPTIRQLETLAVDLIVIANVCGPPFFPCPPR